MNLWLLSCITSVVLSACTSTLTPHDFSTRSYSSIDDFVSRRVLSGKEVSSAYWNPLPIKAHGMSGAIGGVTEINYKVPYLEMRGYCESIGGVFAAERNALSTITGDESLISSFLQVVSRAKINRSAWREQSQKDYFGAFSCTKKGDSWSVLLLPIEYVEFDSKAVNTRLHTLRVAILYGVENLSVVLDRFVSEDAKRKAAMAEQHRREAAMEVRRARADYERRRERVPEVMVLGAKVCRSIRVEERRPLGVSGGTTIYTKPIPRQARITGFSERTTDSKVQIRINGIVDASGTNVEQIGGAVVYRNGALVWEDPIEWEPC